MKRFILSIQIAGCLFGSIYMYKLSNHSDRLIDGNSDSFIFTSLFFLLVTFFFTAVLIKTK
jgi:hypothetical protein